MALAHTAMLNGPDAAAEQAQEQTLERHSDSMPASPLPPSHAVQACSPETSSGAVPTLEDITIVPVANLNSLSLAAAAAAVAGRQQPQGLAFEALRGRRRLLFTQAPRECSEDVIRAWCSQYGAVEQVQQYSDPSQALGAGSGLITMASHDGAAAVLAAFQGSSSPPPAPLDKLCLSWVLLPADDHVSGDSTSAAPALVASANRTVFFAKVPPTALASEVELLFGSFGKLAEVNLFRAWAGAKHSKGCGLITYANRAHAGAAIAQLHGKYVFPGSDCPMVVEWIDLKKQRPMSAVAPSADKPPMGAACDAYKLLLSNIPISISEDALFAALSPFGRLVQLGLVADPAGPCASAHLWLSTKQAADGLLNRIKAENVWLRDARSGHDLALCAKRARRPGLQNSSGLQNSGGSSSTTSRVNVGGYSGSLPGYQSSANMLSSSGSGSSNSSYLPIMHFASIQAAAAAHSQEMHSGSNSARLAAAAAGMAVGGPGSLDYGMLANSNVIRLLPMHQQQHPGMMGQGLVQGGGLAGNGYMAHDVCEAMLDYCDSTGLNMGMPVHLQPTIAAQMASQLAVSSMPCLPPQRQVNSQLCCLPNGALVHHNNSGQQCLSSPANIQGLDEFEGSFAMPALRGNSTTMLGTNLAPGAQQQQQLLALQPPSGVMWQQAPQQQAPHAAQQAALQQQQAQAPQGSRAPQSVIVPIQAYEVQVIAEHLSFFSSNSGARVTITSVPGAGLAVMLSGQPEQVAVAQSLLATARCQ